MFVILIYDAQVRRIGKLRKIAKRYLVPVQRSVFQGYLTQRQCRLMKEEIAAAVDAEKDSVALYKLENPDALILEEIGVSDCRETNIL